MDQITDRVKLEEVPIYKEPEQSLEQYLRSLFGYCVRLHNIVKQYEYLGLPRERAVELFTYLTKNSNEPQYCLMRQITMNRRLLEEKGGTLRDASGLAIAGIFSEVERLKFYVKSTKAKTYEDLLIKTLAEHYYMDGLTVNEIADELVTSEFLDEYSKDEKKEPLLENHRRRIARYVSTFKDFDVIVKE